MCSQYCEIIESCECQRIERRESIVGEISGFSEKEHNDTYNDFMITYSSVRLDIGENTPPGRLLMPLPLKSLIK